MSLSTRIAPHLPYLRRFARAHTGSQSSGDAFVAATLEALILDTSLLPQASSTRIALYKLFCDLYKTTNTDNSPSTSTHQWENCAASRLASISPDIRLAFLLIAVEGFSNDEAAEIISVTPEKLKEMLKSASDNISGQIATRILIIEDEPFIAMDIESIVTALGHQVVGIARTKAEALKLYTDEKPSMILADIQLADGSSGIDAVNEILHGNCPVSVIFITAFPERLLTGQRPEPAFLITKPFNPEMVKALISQALFFKENAKNKN